MGEKCKQEPQSSLKKLMTKLRNLKPQMDNLVTKVKNLSRLMKNLNTNVSKWA